MDNFLKENEHELAQLKMSVQFSQSELHDLKASVKRVTVLHKDYDRISASSVNEKIILHRDRP